MSVCYLIMSKQNGTVSHTTCYESGSLKDGHRHIKLETQLSLTNRATRLEILTFEKYRDLQTGVRGH